MLKFFIAVTILVSTIIGAGMFSLPFIFNSFGWLVGSIYLLIFTLVFSLIHLMYADIFLRDKSNFLLVGYAQKYLGFPGYLASLLAIIFGIFLVLLVYLAIAESFFKILQLDVSILGMNLFTVIFWVVVSSVIFLKIEKLAEIKFFVTIVVIVIITFVFSTSLFFGGDIKNTPQLKSFFEYFFPIGPILFALAGWSAIPALVRYVYKEKIKIKNLFWIIVVGTILPAILYLMFICGILGLSESVSKDAISGLATFSSGLASLLAILGILAISGPYVANGLALKESLRLDLKMPNIFAGFLVVILPIIFYAMGFKNFLALVGFTGGVFLSIESIIIILIWQKINKLGIESILLKKIPGAVIYFLLFVFTIGIFYAIIHYK